MPTLILTKIFPGTAQQFRASMMRRINNLSREGWCSSDHRRLVFGEYPYMDFSYFVPARRDVPYRETFSAPVWKPDVDEVTREITRPQTRASWQVYEWNKASMRPNCHPTEGIYSAGIEVYEEANTRVEFWNGYTPEDPLRSCLEIEPFEEFAEWVIQEVWGAQDTETVVSEIDHAKLRRILVDRFNETELRELFFDLDIEYDSLSGEGTRDKAMELIAYCRRRERIGELVEKGKQLRPDISWSDRKNEQEIATEKRTEDGRTTDERQNQATLEAYFDRMKELLLEKGLRESQKDDEVRSIARTQTLAVLRSLDGGRKGQVIQFLYESRLIGLEHPVVKLHGADLTEADLGGALLDSANLNEADLRGANLRGADLSRTDLSGKTNLSRANFVRAILFKADLRGANLTGADLSGGTLGMANLTGANLTGANLMGANLHGALLSYAKVTDEQLAKAASLTGATLPDGTKVPDEATEPTPAQVSEPTPSTITDKFVYNGTLANFRGHIEYLTDDWQWVASNGECLSIGEILVPATLPGKPVEIFDLRQDPNGVTYLVKSGDACASIVAKGTGPVFVTLRDGHNPTTYPREAPKIGVAFLMLCKEIKGENAQKTDSGARQPRTKGKEGGSTTSIKNERTGIIENKTLRDVWDVLNGLARREQDPVILVGPFNDHSDGLTCILKEMHTTNEGKRLPNERRTGNLQVTPYEVDTFHIVFQRGSISKSLFQNTVDTLQVELGVTPMPAEDAESDASKEPRFVNTIIRRIEKLDNNLGGKLDDLKQGQRVIYKRIDPTNQAVLEVILEEIRQQRMEQGEIQSILDAIRRVLKHVQEAGLPVDDPKIKQSLVDIYQAVNSDLSLRQQLELSIPVIPFLLEYKVGLDAGVDLGAVWKELVERVQKSQNEHKSKVDYRRERIRRWREAIGTCDFRNERFGGTVWYSELRPYLQESVVKTIEAPRTCIVPAEKRSGFAEKDILLDEISRIEREWNLL